MIKSGYGKYKYELRSVTPYTASYKFVVVDEVLWVGNDVLYKGRRYTVNREL